MDLPEVSPAVLQDLGFLRIPHIIGDRSTTPPIPALVPVSKSTLWAWVKTKRFPAPIKVGPRVTAWRVADVRDWLNRQAGPQAKGKG